MKRRDFIKNLIFSLGLFQAGFARVSWAANDSDHPLVKFARSQVKNGALDKRAMDRVKVEARKYVDVHGRGTSELQDALYAIENEFSAKFKGQAKGVFQSIVAEAGLQMRGPIQLPLDDQPLWLKWDRPLEHFRSTPQLVREADVVVVGAGLTGGSTAYHLMDEAKQGKTVVVLDRQGPASGASGKNGGNFELITESWIGENYEGLVRERYKFLKSLYPSVPETALRRQAEFQAEKLMQFCARNSDRFAAVLKAHDIPCDYSPNGWLRIAENGIEEKGIRQEVAFAKKLGIKYEMLTPQQIKAEFGIPAKFAGRIARTSGNYHPAKFTNGIMQVAIDNGVKFYADTQVTRLEQKGTHVLIHTREGTIRAKKVVMATNAFTSQLVPELKGVEPWISQVHDWNHVQDRYKGITFTMEKGDFYGNIPAGTKYTDGKGVVRGTLHLGGGLDRPVPSVNHMNRSKEIMNMVHGNVLKLHPELKGRPPSIVSTGPMAFTRDRLPVVGFHFENGQLEKNIVYAVGMNGYGGSQCMEAGYQAAQMVKTGQVSADLPEDMYSMKRMLTNEPIFPMGADCNVPDLAQKLISKNGK